MFKKWIFYTSIALVVAFITSGFKQTHHQDLPWFYFGDEEMSSEMLPSEGRSEYQAVLYTGKTFTGFKENIAFKESQGKYSLVNPYGYMGKFQFGRSALRAIGITNTATFLHNPELQEKAFTALLSKNKWLLKDEIAEYEGLIVGGVRITESGILAAAHLVGAGSVKKFLSSNGRHRVRDGFGTSLRSYMKRYAGYDTSSIDAQENPQILL